MDRESTSRQVTPGASLTQTRFKDPYDTIYADGDSLYPPSIYNSFGSYLTASVVYLR
jgi:hypothetical protein